MKTKLPYFALIGLLTACGGGGGDGGGSSAGSADSGSPSTTPADASTTEDDVTLRSMSDLSIADGFSFNPVMGHSLDVDISAYSTERAYVSVYGEYVENGDGSYSPNYNSRISSSSLDNGTVSLDFCVSEAQQYVLAEVWFYDGSAPIQEILDTSSMSIIQ
ncbi:hypothetical protein J4N42_17910 [Vibrio sp. SCSIO 43135]|uniref:Lipoprotein n=1 Tax=Vibrio paucivorans TaxID=2829489 RepID=A0A9X3CG10_9VIBR|nr:MULTISPECIES: hypothetical protein [Vibrio]MCW8335179.1 hypothetical protein [Vibrio paucivorans]USD44020.1 hypothetical protein J4N42_17910 [Vibrio sp. SCSIO 43135]